MPMTNAACVRTMLRKGSGAPVLAETQKPPFRNRLPICHPCVCSCKKRSKGSRRKKSSSTGTNPYAPWLPNDVARFIVMLARLALHRLGSIRELDGAAEVFLAAYLSAGGARVTESLPFYEGELYLRGAESDLETRGRQWRQWTESMLDEGL